jgi:hypothetical protein
MYMKKSFKSVGVALFIIMFSIMGTAPLTGGASVNPPVLERP